MKLCDMCTQGGASTPAMYDGRTVFGPWANMCQLHFEGFGTGLGLGIGQRLRTEEATPVPQALGYEEWMTQVDRFVSLMIGISVHDLADADFRDFYDSGMKPKQAAMEAISNDDTFSELMEG